VFVDSRAPSTALRAVPLPRYRGAGKRKRATNNTEIIAMPSDRRPSTDRGNYHKRRTFEQGLAEVNAAHRMTFRLYCDSLDLWRRCGLGKCRRHRCCLGGEPNMCFTRALPFVHPQRRIEARRQVIKGGPRRIAPATHIEWFVRREELKALMRWDFV
jgi:hypothetical protein